MNQTIIKFGYPHNLLKEYKNWIVLLRQNQVTAGSMVLICKDNAESLAEVSTIAYQELAHITLELEQTLKAAFEMDKINYLALMMIDKQVHFHVIPRYSSVRKLGNIVFEDKSWPEPPDLQHKYILSESEFNELKNHLLKSWKKTI